MDTNKIVEQIKEEIRQDILDGIVSSSVKSFSELHNHVDANEYGSLCDEVLYTIDPSDQDQMDQINTIQDIVDKWLSGGRE